MIAIDFVFGADIDLRLKIQKAQTKIPQTEKRNAANIKISGIELESILNAI